MNTLLLVLASICALGILANLVLQLKKAPEALQTVDLSKDLARLEKDLENEKAERNKLSGANKQMFAEHERLKAELGSAMKERDHLQSKETRSEAKREQEEMARREEMEKLQSAIHGYKEEKQRVTREDEARLQNLEQERDRVWADHENAVVATLTDLCKLPHLQFTSYSNTNLPEEFDGKLKPDFLIEFLGQYVIFDAKASKAESLQTYINDAVKSTAEKVKKNSKIYPHVFLVVPTEAIGEMKKLIYAVGEHYFYVVSREALAPILASLKRISTYELAESLDPQKRENIINMLSELATHISYRNAYELLLIKHGADTLERVSHIDPNIAAEVEQKNGEKKMSQFSASEIKRLATSLSEQNLAAQQLAAPKAAVKKKHLQEAEEVMGEKLL